MVTGAGQWKAVAPLAPTMFLPRPKLEANLALVLGRRVTCIVAGSGFGKSTLLASWAGAANTAWYTVTTVDTAMTCLARGIVDALRVRVSSLPHEVSMTIEAGHGPEAATHERARAEAWASLICDTLRPRLSRDLLLILDDLHELGDAAGPAWLLEALCRQAPPALHLVLSSRAELPFSLERLRGQGQVLEITSAELVFDSQDVAAVLIDQLGTQEPPLAGPLHEITGGWPAAVRLCVEALRTVAPADRVQALERVGRPGGSIFAYLAAEVLAAEPPEVSRLVSVAAHVPRLTTRLCEHLGVTANPQVLRRLVRRGLLMEAQTSGPDWFFLHPLVSEVARELLPLDKDEIREVRRRAAEWLEEGGYLEDALRSRLASGDQAGQARILAERGDDLLDTGAVDALMMTAAALPETLWDQRIDRVVGEARRLRGDWDGALECFRRAAQADGLSDAGMAWRMGLIHHLRGELDLALEAYGQCRLDGGQPRDEALVLAWRASARWLRGDAAGCRKDATSALEKARLSGDDAAMAAAHTAMAMLAALEGDRRANDFYYLRALEHAERAGDVVQVIRIRTNRASKRFEEGFYAEALAELEVAIRLAELAGFAAFRALAITNRGETLLHLGRLDEALADLECARALYQDLGSRMVAYPLAKLGDLYCRRGDLNLARASYEEANTVAEASGDLQGLVPALAGLAQVVAADEHHKARRLVERALAYGPGMDYGTTLVAAARVAMAAGDHERADLYAREAASVARGRRERSTLAEALELHALAGEPDYRAVRLREAMAIWRDLGDPIGEGRVELALASVLGPEGGRELADRAQVRLAAAGVHGYAISAMMPARSDEPVPAGAVVTLGSFQVLRAGVAVGVAEWQSRKARDLLKLLVARRGRPTPREVLIDALWPEESSARLAHRLSVALATLRTVLNPGRLFRPEYFIPADKANVWLDLEHLSVDVECFLTRAGAGLALVEAGRSDEARPVLLAAEGMYGGDFLDADRYEEWSSALREEAQSTYARVARALATHASASGNHEGAAHYLLRILEHDPWDEGAHLTLIKVLAATGRHGESRRAYQAYVARMADVAVEAAPYPQESSRGDSVVCARSS